MSFNFRRGNSRGGGNGGRSFGGNRNNSSNQGGGGFRTPNRPSLNRSSTGTSLNRNNSRVGNRFNNNNNNNNNNRGGGGGGLGNRFGNNNRTTGNRFGGGGNGGGGNGGGSRFGNNNNRVGGTGGGGNRFGNNNSRTGTTGGNRFGGGGGRGGGGGFQRNNSNSRFNRGGTGSNNGDGLDGYNYNNNGTFVLKDVAGKGFCAVLQSYDDQMEVSAEERRLEDYQNGNNNGNNSNSNNRTGGGGFSFNRGGSNTGNNNNSRTGGGFSFNRGGSNTGNQGGGFNRGGSNTGNRTGGGFSFNRGGSNTGNRTGGGGFGFNRGGSNTGNRTGGTGGGFSFNRGGSSTGNRTGGGGFSFNRGGSGNRTGGTGGGFSFNRGGSSNSNNNNNDGPTFNIADHRGDPYDYLDEKIKILEQNQSAFEISLKDKSKQPKVPSLGGSSKGDAHLSLAKLPSTSSQLLSMQTNRGLSSQRNLIRQINVSRQISSHQNDAQLSTISPSNQSLTLSPRVNVFSPSGKSLTNSSMSSSFSQLSATDSVLRGTRRLIMDVNEQEIRQKKVRDRRRVNETLRNLTNSAEKEDRKANRSTSPIVGSSEKDQLIIIPDEKEREDEESTLEEKPFEYKPYPSPSPFIPSSSTRNSALEESVMGAGRLMGDPSRSPEASPSKRKGFPPPMSYSTFLQSEPPSAPSSLPIFSKLGYELSPSMDELKTMSTEDLSSVVDFTVSRPGFGSIRWLEPVDLRGENIDEHVEIGKKYISVYEGMGERKPAVGTGLNKPTRVTLERVFPKKTMDEDEYTDFLKTHCEKAGSDFINYDPFMGVWQFNTHHFSKYGLDDDDDDDDNNVENKNKNKQRILKGKKKVLSPGGNKEGQQGLSSSKTSSSLLGTNQQHNMIELEVQMRSSSPTKVSTFRRDYPVMQTATESLLMDEDEEQGQVNEMKQLPDLSWHSVQKRLVEEERKLHASYYEDSSFQHELQMNTEQYNATSNAFSSPFMSRTATSSTPLRRHREQKIRIGPSSFSPPKPKNLSSPFDDVTSDLSSIGEDYDDTLLDVNEESTEDDSYDENEEEPMMEDDHDDRDLFERLYAPEPPVLPMGQSPCFQLWKEVHESTSEASPKELSKPSKEDYGMFMARSFRVGFSSNGMLAVPTRLDGASSISLVRFDPFPLWKEEKCLDRYDDNNLQQEEDAYDLGNKLQDKRSLHLEASMSEHIISILNKQLSHSFVDFIEQEYELSETYRVPSGILRADLLPYWQLEDVDIDVSWMPYAHLLDYVDAVIDTIDVNDGRNPPQTVDAVFVSALQLCMTLFGQESQWRHKLVKDVHFPEKRVFHRTRLPIPHMDLIGGEREDDGLADDYDDDFGLKESLVERRFELLSRWLLEVLPNTQTGHEEEVASRLFSLLVQHKIQEALHLATEHRFFRLASILTQMMPNPDASVQHALRNQLAYWEDNGTNEEELRSLIPTALLDVYRLISGAFEDIPLSSPSSFWVQLTPDWITHFSLYTWYKKSSETPFADTLASFEVAVRDQRVLEPQPHYNLFGSHQAQRKAHSRPSSIFYQLIRFAFGTDLSSEEASHLLSRMLSGEGVTSDPLDNRASWVLLTFFSTLYGKDYIDPIAHFSILSSFSFQLCHLNLWEYAVFLSLCSPSEYVREHFAKELIFRFAPIFADEMEDEQKRQIKEQKRAFLTEELKVPECWLWEADAVYQGHLGHYLQATELYKQAGMNEDYWRIVDTFVAPEFYLANQLEELEEVILEGLEGPTTPLSTLFAFFLEAKEARKNLQDLYNQETETSSSEDMKQALTHLRSTAFTFLDSAVLWDASRPPLKYLPPSERKRAIKARLCVGSMTSVMLNFWNFAMDTLLPFLEESEFEQDLLECEEEWVQMERLQPALPLLQTDAIRSQRFANQGKGLREQAGEYQSEDEDFSFGF